LSATIKPRPSEAIPLQTAFLYAQTSLFLPSPSHYFAFIDAAAGMKKAKTAVLPKGSNSFEKIPWVFPWI
jgi:hypothetical protein